MSERSIWKMLHLLYNLPPGQNGLSYAELNTAGLTCGPDTLDPLKDNGATRVEGDRVILNPAARTILQNCVVANRRWSSKDMLVDYPKAFVIMPFSQPWSDGVEKEMIRPAVELAGLEYARGDTCPRVNDLTQNVWNELLVAGVVLADISSLNANVFYELGLAHALGKDVFVLKQKRARVPADFKGAHYYEYDLKDLPAGRDKLQKGLEAFAAGNLCSEVKRHNRLAAT